MYVTHASVVAVIPRRLRMEAVSISATACNTTARHYTVHFCSMELHNGQMDLTITMRLVFS